MVCGLTNRATPAARRAGEPSSLTKVMDVAFGWADPEQKEPFLAAVDQISESITVFFLGSSEGGELGVVRKERYEGLGNVPSGLVIRNMDLLGGDDICRAARAGPPAPRQQTVRLDFDLRLPSTGNSMAARTAITPITTSSSTRLNPPSALTFIFTSATQSNQSRLAPPNEKTHSRRASDIGYAN